VLLWLWQEMSVSQGHRGPEILPQIPHARRPKQELRSKPKLFGTPDINCALLQASREVAVTARVWAQLPLLVVQAAPA